MSAADQAYDRVLQFLKGSSFLGGLPDEAIAQIIRGGSRKHYYKGHAIFWRGDPGDSALVVLSGRLKVLNTTYDGHEIGLNFLGAGDIAGEIALLDGNNRTANVVAIEDTEAFVIQRRDLLPVLLAHPEAMLELVVTLCEKLRLATVMIEDGSHDMSVRLARGLLRLAEQHGMHYQNQIRIDLPISQAELGSYLGLSRANVSRLLARLQNDDVIALERQRIVILDRPRLASMTVGNPRRNT